MKEGRSRAERGNASRQMAWTAMGAFVAMLAVVPVAAQAAPAVSNVLNKTDLFFQGWHGSPPGGCVSGDNSRPNVIKPDTQICPGSGAFITALEILNGSYAGFPGVWQVTAVCNDGTRLATAPASITDLVENPFLTKLAFPLGLTSVTGRSGNWIDQLLGVPDLKKVGGGGWQDRCPDESLISGLQAWVTPANGTAVLGTNCVAGGLRFQCNGSYVPIAIAPTPATAPSPNSPNPIVDPNNPPESPSSSSRTPMIAGILGAVTGIALLSGLVVGCCLVRRRRREAAGKSLPRFDHLHSDEKIDAYFAAASSESTATKMPSTTLLSALEGQWRAFDWGDVSKATDNFHVNNLLGEGGFGRVYRGKLPTGQPVAIKQLKGEITDDFLSELRVLSRVRHRNLVALHGFSAANGNFCLILDYAQNGSLDSALRQAEVPLSWEVRLNIAIGAARGLSYLHNDMRPIIIHRDIKASNILLDDNLEAQVADFGMAKVAGLDAPGVSLLTTTIKGTLGYVAPEYAQFGRVTPKCDVYSFGVLLMEIVTASQAITADASGTVTSLVKRVALLRKEGGAAATLDPRLRGAAPLDQVNRVIAIASACVQDEELLRPTMSGVLRSLENVSQGIHMGKGEKSSFNSGPSDLESPQWVETDLESNGWHSSGGKAAPFSTGYEMSKLQVGR